jgi:nitrile hydratase accessory protein
VFSAPWEAQAFAMAVRLNADGLFTWQEWAAALALEIKKGDQPYYEQWLSALETLLQDKVLIDREERHHRIKEWDYSARHTPHGQAIVLRRLAQD